jgi:tetratricopeptide (TPR) repeat protein
VESELGHLEHALPLHLREAQLVGKDRQIVAGARITGVTGSQERAATLLGDYSGELAAQLKRRELKLLGVTSHDLAEPHIAATLANLHDLRGAKAELGFDPETPDETRQKDVALRAIDISGEDWAAAESRGAEASLPPSALVLAHLGRLDEAKALIGATRLDNVSAVIERGRIAALAGDGAGADHWFGEAVRMAPSLPMANYFWGRALLQRGQPDLAAAKLALAAEKGPRFADAWSAWGEALLAQGQAQDATAKFKLAHTYAPRWGRNHLKWGEALAKLGKADAAKAQFATAARLDLTPTEHAELARLQGAK